MTSDIHRWLQEQVQQVQRELKRWERRKARLQQQLHTLAPPTPRPAGASDKQSDASKDAANAAADDAHRPHKRRIVTVGGVERIIGQLQRKESGEEHKQPHDNSAPTSDSSNATSPAGASSPSAASFASELRNRNRRMFAGLLSHLAAASSSLSHDVTLSKARSVTERITHNKEQEKEDKRRKEENEAKRSLAACEDVMTLLRRKECGARYGWLQRLRSESERWRDEWLWTREEGGQTSIAWRVRDMTETWRVVKEEEAKERNERRAAAPAVPQLEEDEWMDEDEKRLQRLLEDERAKESASTTVQLGRHSVELPRGAMRGDSGGGRADNDRVGQEQENTRGGGEQENAGGRAWSPKWKRGVDDRTSGRDSRERGGTGAKRGRDDDERSSHPDRADLHNVGERRDGEAARRHSEPQVPQSADDSIQSLAAVRAAEETEEQRMERERVETAKDEETQRLLDAV